MSPSAHWRTYIFTGATPDEATARFDAWTRTSPIMALEGHGQLMYLSHHSTLGGYEIHVTAYMAVDSSV